MLPFVLLPNDKNKFIELVIPIDENSAAIMSTKTKFDNIKVGLSLLVVSPSPN
jgi:hypothetical protein